MKKLIFIPFLIMTFYSSAQNVGIGTTTPSALLHINGNSSVGYPHLRLEENEYDFARLSYYNSGTSKFWDIAARSEDNDANSALNFYNSSTGNLLSIKGNGNIGVGNIDPIYKMDITGRLRIRNSTGTAGIYFDGTTLAARSFIGAINDDYMGLWGAGTNWNMVMNVNNGNIGLGNIDPSYKMDITGRLRLRNSTQTAGMYFDGTTLPNRSFFGTLNEDHVGIWGAGVGRNMVMNVNNGNIGIGNTNPLYPLNFENTLGEKISFWNSGSSCYGIGLQNYLLQFHTAGPDDDISFGYGNSTNMTDLMRINGNGNIGIGKSNPTSKLHVMSNSSLGTPTLKLEESEDDFSRIGLSNSGSTKFWEIAAKSNDDDVNSYCNIFNSSSGNLLTIRGNGNIGINHSNPEYPLNFGNTLGDKISFWNSGNNNYGIGLQDFLLQIHTASAADDIAFGHGNSSTLNELMRIKGNGNVGIGNANPGYKLDISGRLRLRNSSQTAGIYFDGTSLQNRSFVGTLNEDHVGFWGAGAGWNMVMNVNNGNVGIGNSNPTSKLEVNGFTKLGSNAPAIKMKQVDDVLNVTSGQTKEVNLGVATLKIVSVNVMVGIETSSGSPGWVPNSYTAVSQHEFTYHVVNGVVVITPKSGNSANILNKSIRILVTYTE